MMLLTDKSCLAIGPSLRLCIQSIRLLPSRGYSELKCRAINTWSSMSTSCQKRNPIRARVLIVMPLHCQALQTGAWITSGLSSVRPSQALDKKQVILHSAVHLIYTENTKRWNNR